MEAKLYLENKDSMLLEAIRNEFRPIKDFYIEIVGNRPKSGDCCETVPLFSESYGLYGTQIRINEDHGRIKRIHHFFHESCHVKDYERQRGVSEKEFDDSGGLFCELRSDVYSFARLISFLLRNRI